MSFTTALSFIFDNSDVEYKFHCAPSHSAILFSKGGMWPPYIWCVIKTPIICTTRLLCVSHLYCNLWSGWSKYFLHHKSCLIVPGYKDFWIRTSSLTPYDVTQGHVWRHETQIWSQTTCSCLEILVTRNYLSRIYDAKNTCFIHSKGYLCNNVNVIRTTALYCK